MKIWKFKYFVPVVSFLFVVLGSYATVSLVLNSWALEKGSFRGTWPLNERCAIVVLMVTEVLFLLVTLIGFCGVFCRSVVIWYIPGFILLGTGVALLAFGTVSLRESTKDFTLDIFRAIRKVNGSLADDYLNWISNIQWEHDCCGVISYKDYLQFNFPSLPHGSVPDTCCDRSIRIPHPKCGFEILVPEKSIEKVEEVLMTKGCGGVISKIQGMTLWKLGTEMLIVGFLALSLAIFIYVGIFKIVATEYAELDGTETSGNEEAGTGLSQTVVSSTTAANTSANSTGGIVRNSANRRIFRTRRHGGGESIVSFAVDLENNNVGSNAGSSSMSHRQQHLSGGRKVQGHAKGRVRAQTMGRIKPKGQITKDQRQRRGPQKMASGKRFLSSSKEKLEMLLKPRDNNSIISTTPYPSTHNFIAYFRQSQEPGSKRDSDPNMSRSLGHSSGANRNQTLTHYSSLPQVQTPASSACEVKQIDAKGKVMAELKQRFPPPTGRNSSSPPPIPPATSQTQHHHYYKIPSEATTSPDDSTVTVSSPCPNEVSTSLSSIFLDRKLPSRILVESTLATIQEEGESAASTLQSVTTQQHVSIFEVFNGVTRSNTLLNEPSEVDLKNDSEENTHARNSVLVIKEDTDGLENDASMQDLPNCKIEVEPIDTMVYFQV